MHFLLIESRQDSAVNLTTSTNGTSSISMSVELNGVVYTGGYHRQEVETTSSLNILCHSERKVKLSEGKLRSSSKECILSLQRPPLQNNVIYLYM